MKTLAATTFIFLALAAIAIGVVGHTNRCFAANTAAIIQSGQAF